jgi:alpha-glucosidase
MSTQLKWWQKAIFYQIYPRSFADGNGDGIGDIPGIIEKLDYLQDLGVDAVWLSPHYPSPQYDCGYDITDYTGVAPEYGTPEDFKRFLQEAHQRDIRVILDLVLNHTSNQHPWFIESRSSLQNARRDWYIWRDGKTDIHGRIKPPNNWNSYFDGKAWEYDELTGQYYYHFFFKQQPDLNWRNPEVRKAMWSAVRYWLDLGVDGFRLDAIATIFEDPDLPDHTSEMTLAGFHRLIRSAASPQEQASIQQTRKRMFRYQLQQPGMHDLMQELRSVVDGYDDCVLVAEDDDISYHGEGDNELNLVFNFPLMRTDRLTPDWVRSNQKKRLAALAAISPSTWPCNTLGNHDSPRVFSRYGDGIHDNQIARISLALMLTLRGTPFLYYGEEIGMTDLTLEDIDQFRDLMGTWQYHAEINEFGTPPDQALKIANQLTRDRCRTPMQWTSTPNAGFSPAGVRTWLPVNPNFSQGTNVANQLRDPDSMLSFYKRLVRLRRSAPALIEGVYIPIHELAQGYLAYIRQSETQTCLVLLNMSDHHQDVPLDFGRKPVRLLLSSHQREINDRFHDQIRLFPYEVTVFEMG